MEKIENVKFVREYKRQSRSPFEGDTHTILLLADVSEEEGQLYISFSRYIYLHRDSCGRALGISISKSLVNEHPNIEQQYLTGADMTGLLLFYKEELTAFCSYFSDEFEQLYMMPPHEFFEAAELRWNRLVIDG